MSPNSHMKNDIVKICFGHVQLLMFAAVIFWSCSIVNVRGCNFFGNVLTKIWSYLFGHVN